MKHRHHTEHENEQQKLMLTNKHTDVFISNENLFTCRGFLFCITANKPYIQNIKIFINITNEKKKPMQSSIISIIKRKDPLCEVHSLKLPFTHLYFKCLMKSQVTKNAPAEHNSVTSVYNYNME